MNRPAALPFTPVAPARFTTDQFVVMLEAGVFQDGKIELVDGVVRQMPPPLGAHSSQQTAIAGKLWPTIGGRVMVEAGIDLGNDTALAADVAVLAAPMPDRRLVSANEVVLAIEIAESTLSRDLGMKRERYAAARIPHYWVVDGERSVVHVYGEPIAGDYAQVHTVRFGEPLAVPGTEATITID